jgi:hypothetical protein
MPTTDECVSGGNHPPISGVVYSTRRGRRPTAAAGFPIPIPDSYYFFQLEVSVYAYTVYFLPLVLGPTFKTTSSVSLDAIIR